MPQASHNPNMQGGSNFSLGLRMMHVTHQSPNPGAPQTGKSAIAQPKQTGGLFFVFYFLFLKIPEREKRRRADEKERARTQGRPCMRACHAKPHDVQKATYIRHHRSTIPPHPRAPRVYLSPRRQRARPAMDQAEPRPRKSSSRSSRRDVPPQNLGAKTRQHPHDRASFTGMVPPPPAAEQIDVG